jgi:hypothetical protein
LAGGSDGHGVVARESILLAARELVVLVLVVGVLAWGLYEISRLSRH